MLESIGYILIGGLIFGWMSKQLKVPGLLGMLLAGILLGPYVLNGIDSSILMYSADIRKMALIIILTRAGLSLNLEDLKKVGRPAFLMCFVPACFEILGMILIAPRLFSISILDAAILGSVIAAVSPAVIVPSMIKLIEKGYGTKQGIPQLILAGASVDDVFVIVLFTAFTSLATGSQVSMMSFVNIPISIVLGIIIGFVLGKIFLWIFQTFNVRNVVRVLAMLSVFFILVMLEDRMPESFSFSSLISIMACGLSIRQSDLKVAEELSIPFNKLWIAGEVLLFVLVGASVDIQYAFDAGFVSVVIIMIVLVFRMVGVFVSLLKTNLSMKERLFCMIAYTPKATVQAAIGGIPLAMGLSVGNIVLTVAVVSILLTAPIGAFVIEHTYSKLLQPEC